MTTPQQHQHHTDPARAPFRDNVRTAWRCLWRSLRLRCPECGASPVFCPLHRVRGWRDWSTPLDGCPRCGYAYEREPGYFLLAIWGVHYFVVAGFGLLLGLLLDVIFHPPLGWLVLLASVPTVIFGVLFVRHAKSIYLAIDHFFDPHLNEQLTAKSRRREGKQERLR